MSEQERREMDDFLDETFERWSPDEERLEDLERMLDRDDGLDDHGLALMSPQGREAMKAAITRTRERRLRRPVRSTIR